MMVYSVSINGNMECYSMEQQLNHTSMLTQYILKMTTYVVYRPEGMSFRRPVVTRLITALESHPLPNLTANEQAHLIVLIQTVLEVGSFVIRFQFIIYFQT